MNIRSSLLLFSSLLLPISVLADTVVYTDAGHPPANITPDTQVVFLDGPTQLLAQWFGELPDDPQQAAGRATAQMQSPQWAQRQQQLAASWRGVIRAHALAVGKYPAVVFDDREVVYGTADVAKASALRARGGVR